ncbi:uncharacterized protein K444DRAFT_634176 [Hyaloscypha bicolor E]|uniref:F-box domain-containing protein n=1 Tax=Hyaloscypha bicolor E TaxID=1095630 RepID=A0A2J6SX48_9HELO|nr:uncharacterized protein K444DRAFT_634176 [Hyaloscypha bicolor E]PMD55342.1 hypothetical protein K444DRAFT_634176 [Hyaloscypha bicolor E]
MSIQKAILDPRVSPPVLKLHFDIWHQILSYLPNISRRTLTHLTGNKFPLWSNNNELKHQKVWDLIFDNYEFLEYMSDCGYLCILIGSDLQYLYNYNSREALYKRSLKDRNDLNLALIILQGNQRYRSWAGQPGTSRIVGDFINSARKELKQQIHISDTRWDVPGTLQIHHRPGKRKRYTIRLNIESLSKGPLPDRPSIELACEALVSLKGDYLNSAYLYWKYDRKLLRLIEPPDIVGVGRYASVRGTKEWVKDVCGLKIQHPEEVPELCHHQPPCIPSFKKKRSKGWNEVHSSFEGAFPCQILFHKGLGRDRQYYARVEQFPNGHLYIGWHPDYRYIKAKFPANYRGEKDWETDPIMEKRIY